MTEPEQTPATPPPTDPRPTREAPSIWPILLAVSLASFIAVTAFGAGILAERDLFAVGLVDRAREIGGLATDVDPDSGAAFPRLTEVKRLVEEEYYYRPTSDAGLADFRAKLDQAAVAGMATAAAAPPATDPFVPAASFATPIASPAAATPVAAGEDLGAYLRRLEDGALHGLTEGLDDEYSEYLEPAAQAPIARDLRGQYEGIGVWVERPEGRFVIVAPIPGSPAEEAGLLPGDEIVAADGVPLLNLPEDQALALIKGPPGSSVRLTVRRPERPDPFEIEVARRAVVLPTVVYAPAADGRIGLIRIAIFNEQTARQLDEALRRAEDDGVDGLVLDLRGNGGGYVTAARETIGRFVPADRGPALYEDVDPEEDGDLETESISGGGEEAFAVPLVVLVDGGTASAAEIVAGALRDYDRARLVGTHTFGKGLVQRVHDFPDGSSVRITFAQWLTPNKTPIPEDGLQPDVVVEPPLASPPPAPAVAPAAPDAVPALADPQFDRAVDLVLDGA